MIFHRLNGLICKGFTLIYGCFLKWWYPQITLFNRVFHCKPSILGYHHFRKPPYVDVCASVFFFWHTIDWCASYSSKTEVTRKFLMLLRVLIVLQDTITPYSIRINMNHTLFHDTGDLCQYQHVWWAPSVHFITLRLKCFQKPSLKLA